MTGESKFSTRMELLPLYMLFSCSMIHRVEHVNCGVNKVVSGTGLNISKSGNLLAVGVVLVYKWLYHYS